MFENFVQGKIDNENAIIKNLIESTSSGEFVSKADILNSGLSDFTKNYLLFDDNEKSSIEELSSKISKSNKLLFNYTTRPKWTLQTFLFNNFESRPPNEIVKKLNLFTFYNFYTDAIKDFIKENSEIFITRHEITSVIEHTNKAIYEKLTNEIRSTKIKNLLMQIFLLKYEAESNYNLESSVPYSFIHIFLEDKSFLDLEKKFNSVKGLKTETEISLKDIIKVLTDKYDVSETSEIPEKISEPVKVITKVPVVKDEIIITEKENTEAKEVEIELKEKKKTEPAESESKKEIEIKKEAKTEDNTAVLYSEQLITAEQERNEEIANDDDKTSSTENELKSLFNQKQLKKILSKVYKSDLTHFESSLDTMSNFSNWSDASGHLKDIFKLNNVDLFNKYVVLFVNTLNDYYKNKE